MEIHTPRSYRRRTYRRVAAPEPEVKIETETPEVQPAPEPVAGPVLNMRVETVAGTEPEPKPPPVIRRIDIPRPPSVAELRAAYEKAAQEYRDALKAGDKTKAAEAKTTKLAAFKLFYDAERAEMLKGT